MILLVYKQEQQNDVHKFFGNARRTNTSVLKTLEKKKKKKNFTHFK
jgi:hypothetical protein